MISNSHPIIVASTKTLFVIKSIEWMLYVSALGLAGVVSLREGRALLMQNMIFFSAATIMLFIPFRSLSLQMLRTLVALYLIGVMISETIGIYFNVSAAGVNVNLSYSLPVWTLCFLGYLVGKIAPNNRNTDKNHIFLTEGVLATLTVIVAHMTFLALLLAWHYQYGYEHDFAVLGRICLYVLIINFLRRPLNKLLFCRCLGLMFIVFILICFLKG